jgi:hypothetical protein
MSDTIVRLYASLEQAQAAAARLRAFGYHDEIVTIVTAASKPPANAPASAASPDPVLSSIMAKYILRAHAEVYAAKVHAGGTLLIAEPFFGGAAMAIDLLEATGQTIDTGVRTEPKDPLPLWDDAAPFSSTFSLPTIIRNPGAMSALFPFPLITRRFRTLSSALGIPALSSRAGFLTGSLPEQGPLTARLGLPLLIRR